MLDLGTGTTDGVPHSSASDASFGGNVRHRRMFQHSTENDFPSPGYIYDWSDGSGLCIRTVKVNKGFTLRPRSMLLMDRDLRL